MEYKASFSAVVDESTGLSMSDEAAKSVRENVAGSLEDLQSWTKLLIKPVENLGIFVQ